MPSTITVRFLFAAVTEKVSVVSTPIALPTTEAGTEFCPRSVGKLFTCEYCALTLCVSENPKSTEASEEASVNTAGSHVEFSVISKLDWSPVWPLLNKN